MDTYVDQFIAVIIPPILDAGRRKLTLDAIQRELTFTPEGDYLTPIQVMKQELVELFDEIKSDIKLEIRMEMRTELDSVKQSGQSNTPAISGRLGKSDTMTLEPFSTKKSAHPGINMQSGTRPDIPCSLENNALFRQVTQNIERGRAGKALYTAEELITARGDRFDKDNREMLLSTVTEYNKTEDEDDALWDKMLLHKYGGGSGDMI